jgi:hypothetical protein
MESNEPILEIEYPILEKAGVRDWRLNNFYDLSFYKNLSDSGLFHRLTGITILHTKELICGLEFFYDNISSGEFLGMNSNVKNSEIIKTVVNFEEGEHLSSAYGTFDTDYITTLIFCLSSGRRTGFSSESSKTKTNQKRFLFKSEKEIVSFKFALGKYLTFISPVYKEEAIFTTSYSDKLLSAIIRTPKIGKKFDDSKQSIIPEENYTKKINTIKVFHDNKLVKGHSLYYLDGSIFTTGQDLQNHLCETLNLAIDEKINKIMIRAGDMIDNITIFTNKGNSLSAGGYGGAIFVYDISDYEFVGFEGGYFGNLHYNEIVLLKHA